MVPDHVISEIIRDMGDGVAVIDRAFIAKEIRAEIDYVMGEADKLFRSRAMSAPAPTPTTAKLPQYLTRKEAAAIVGITADHLGRLNAKGEGPMPRRLRPTAGKGSPVLYRPEDVEAYLLSSGQSRSADAAREIKAPAKRKGRPPNFMRMQ